MIKGEFIIFVNNWQNPFIHLANSAVGGCIMKHPNQWTIDDMSDSEGFHYQFHFACIYVIGHF